MRAWCIAMVVRALCDASCGAGSRYIVNFRTKNRRRQYLVHWRGTAPEEDEWFKRRDLMEEYACVKGAMLCRCCVQPVLTRGRAGMALSFVTTNGSTGLSRSATTMTLRPPQLAANPSPCSRPNHRTGPKRRGLAEAKTAATGL